MTTEVATANEVNDNKETPLQIENTMINSIVHNSESAADSEAITVFDRITKLRQESYDFKVFIIQAWTI